MIAMKVALVWLLLPLVFTSLTVQAPMGKHGGQISSLTAFSPEDLLTTSNSTDQSTPSRDLSATSSPANSDKLRRKDTKKWDTPPTEVELKSISAPEYGKKKSDGHTQSGSEPPTKIEDQKFSEAARKFAGWLERSRIFSYHEPKQMSKVDPLQLEIWTRGFVEKYYKGNKRAAEVDMVTYMRVMSMDEAKIRMAKIARSEYNKRLARVANNASSSLKKKEKKRKREQESTPPAETAKLLHQSNAPRSGIPIGEEQTAVQPSGLYDNLLLGNLQAQHLEDQISKATPSTAINLYSPDHLQGQSVQGNSLIMHRNDDGHTLQTHTPPPSKDLEVPEQWKTWLDFDQQPLASTSHSQGHAQLQPLHSGSPSSSNHSHPIPDEDAQWAELLEIFDGQPRHPASP